MLLDHYPDFYGEAVTHEYLQILNVEPGWQETLTKYNVQWVIVPPARPLARELARSGDWREWFRDETAVVWVRK